MFNFFFSQVLFSRRQQPLAVVAGFARFESQKKFYEAELEGRIKYESFIELSSISEEEMESVINEELDHGQEELRRLFLEVPPPRGKKNCSSPEELEQKFREFVDSLGGVDGDIYTLQGETGQYIGRISAPEWVDDKFRAFEWHGGKRKEIKLSHAEFFMQKGWEYGWDF